MARQTSLEAYQRIQEDGSLSRAQWQVYAALFASDDGLTRNELDAHLSPGMPNAMHSRRLAEMERLQVIRRVGVRLCRVSNNECEVWDVTSELPSKIGKAVPAPPMPSRDEAGLALPFVAALVDSLGVAPPPSLVVLRDWLAGGAPRSAPRRPARVSRAGRRGSASPVAAPAPAPKAEATTPPPTPSAPAQGAAAPAASPQRPAQVPKVDRRGQRLLF